MAPRPWDLASVCVGRRRVSFCGRITLCDLGDGHPNIWSHKSVLAAFSGARDELSRQVREVKLIDTKAADSEVTIEAPDLNSDD